MFSHAFHQLERYRAAAADRAPLGPAGQEALTTSWASVANHRHAYLQTHQLACIACFCKSDSNKAAAWSLYQTLWDDNHANPFPGAFQQHGEGVRIPFLRTGKTLNEAARLELIKTFLCKCYKEFREEKPIDKWSSFFMYNEPHIWSDHRLADGFMTFIIRIASGDSIRPFLPVQEDYGNNYGNDHMARKAAVFSGILMVGGVIGYGASVLTAHIRRDYYHGLLTEAATKLNENCSIQLSVDKTTLQRLLEDAASRIKPIPTELV